MRRRRHRIEPLPSWPPPGVRILPPAKKADPEPPDAAPIPPEAPAGWRFRLADGLERTALVLNGLAEGLRAPTQRERLRAQAAELASMLRSRRELADEMDVRL